MKGILNYLEWEKIIYNKILIAIPKNINKMNSNNKGKCIITKYKWIKKNKILVVFLIVNIMNTIVIKYKICKNSKKKPSMVKCNYFYINKIIKIISINKKIVKKRKMKQQRK